MSKERGLRTEVTGGKISLETLLLGTRSVVISQDEGQTSYAVASLNQTYVTTTTPFAFAQARRTCSGWASRRSAISRRGVSTAPPGRWVIGLHDGSIEVTTSRGAHAHENAVRFADDAVFISVVNDWRLALEDVGVEENLQHGCKA